MRTLSGCVIDSRHTAISKACKCRNLFKCVEMLKVFDLRIFTFLKKIDYGKTRGILDGSFPLFF